MQVDGDPWHTGGVGLFNENLQRALERAELDQKQLAKRVGVSPTTVNKWLRLRDRLPTGDTLHRVAHELGITVADLLGESARPRKERPVPSTGGTLLGLAALEVVLRDYVWPADIDPQALTDVMDLAREEAAQVWGERWPESAWRTRIAQLLSQRWPAHPPRPSRDARFVSPPVTPPPSPRETGRRPRKAG